MDLPRLPELSPEARKAMRAHVDARIEDRKNALAGFLDEKDTLCIRIELKMLRWLGELCDDPDAPTPQDEWKW